MGQYTGAVLTIVGYAVGTYFGYPQLGAIVGAAVGYMVQPDLPTQRGPRLDDRRVQVSTYGVTAPLAYGAVRLAGNVIWSRDLEEIETETEVGGKGGPSQTQVAYTYFGTFAVLLCKNRVRGIRRIWADAVLIYDGTAFGAPPPNFGITFYSGTEDQLPDPTMEAALGVGNVPAYRGFSYIVFNRMPLETFGNRLPSMSVEVVGDGEWGSTKTNIGTAATAMYANAVQRLDGRVVAVSEPVEGTTRLSIIDPATGAVLRTEDHAVDLDWSQVFLYPSSMLYVPPTNEVWIAQGDEAFERYSAETLARLGTVALNHNWNSVVGAYEPSQRRVVVHRASSQVGSTTVAVVELGGTEIFTSIYDPGSDSYSVSYGTEGLFYGGQIVTGGNSVFVVCNGLHEFGVFSVGVNANITPLLATQSTPGSGNAGAWDMLHQRYVIAGKSGTTGAVWTVTDTNPPVITMHTVTGMFATASPEQVQYIAGLDVIVVYTSIVGIVIMTVIDGSTFEVLHENDSLGTSGITRAFPSPDDPGRVFVQGNYQPYNVQVFGTTVGAVVQDLCEQSGLVPADFDVSALVQPLRGYLVSQLAPARGAIDQLANAFLFEGIEQDDVLLFRRRGGAMVATLALSDCGAGTDNAAEHPIRKTRAQEADLPAKLYVTSPDPYTDHQPGTQYSERQASHAGEDDQLQLAVVMTPTESRRLADALLFDLWASRNRRTWSTTRKFARLVPSDPIMLDGERVRILSRSDDGPVIRWEGVTDDADVVVQLSSGVQGAFPTQTVVVNVPTTMMLLDIALLRDADDEPGAYVAAFGVPPNWRGAVIYTSTDDGVTWTRVLTVPRPGSAVGVATNALGAWTGGNAFDESNSLNVSLYNGAAESTTRLGVLNGGNALAISGPQGWEVLQYRDAVLEDDGTYTLTGLLRGRRGTDYAMAGHAQGDAVVLLSASMIRNLAIDSAVIGVERPYRAVSVGDTITNTSEHDETITAERLRPWSPVQLGGGRDAGGDVLLQWRRRTRVGGEWRDSVDASLGEETEAYEVDIFTSSARTVVTRTITGLTTPSTTYTVAQQTTDFGVPQGTVYWAAYQMSATVGRGHGADGTT